MGTVIKGSEKVVISSEFMKELESISKRKGIGMHLLAAYAGMLYSTIAIMNAEEKLLAHMDIPVKRRKLSLMGGNHG